MFKHLFCILAFLSILFLSKAKSAEVYGPPLPPPKPAAPIFNCSEQKWTWKNILEGDLITHTFDIYNKGDAILKIISVRPSCGCTTVDFSKTILPGKKGYIKAQIKTANFRDRTITKTIRLTTNDVNHKQVILYMEGKVDALLKFDPSYPNMETLRGDTISTTVNIKSDVAEDIKIISVEGRKTQKTMCELSEIKKGKEYKLTLKVDTMKTKTNLYYDKLTLKVLKGDSKKEYSIPLNFRLKLVDTINVSPKYLTFRQYMLQQYMEGKSALPTRTTVLRGWKGHTFKITKIDIKELKTMSGSHAISTEPVIAVETDKTTEPKNLYKLKIKVIRPDDKTRRYARYRIIIHTDDKATPTLESIVTVYFPNKNTTVRIPYKPRTSSTSSRFSKKSVK